MHVASYRKIKAARRIFVTLYTNIPSLFLIIPDFINVVYSFYTHQKVINYNCLKDSKQLINEPASEKKKKKTTIITKTNTKEI